MTFSNISRRSALQAMAGAGALLVLGGCAPAQGGSAGGATSAASQTAAQARESLKWWQDIIVYEAYPKSFLDTEGQGTGTINGITEKLDYLASLGVGAIWLTPVYRSPMKDNGYDVADYYDIDPRFGTMADFERLVSEAGRRDIRIVMDLVMNHTSNESAWFQESSSSRDNDKADWYIWRDPADVDAVASTADAAGANASADTASTGTPADAYPTNWRSIFGGPAWTWCEARQQFYLHTFADFQPDLNWECKAMREELFRMARFWLDKGVGGFRIDAVTYIKKPEFENGEPDAADGMSGIHAATANTPGILDFLHEFKREVLADTDAFAVGEANGVPSDQLREWVGEDGVFDMIFEFSHILVPLGGKEVWHEPTDWKLTDLKAAITASEQSTAESGWYPIFFENHDQARSVDQFMPNARDKQAAAKTLGCVLMTLRGTPFLYQGEELGMGNVAWPSIDYYDDISSHNQYNAALEAGKSEEEALAGVHAHSRDNARTPMQWDDSANAGFTTGEPWLPVHDDYETSNAEAQDADPNSVLSWYRDLAELRRALPVLAAGDYRELMAESEQVFAFERTCGQDRAVVLANFTEETVSYDASPAEGLTCMLGTHGPTELGVLRPLEAVVLA